ncbi:Pol-like protein [Plakobranchus ocellatus]|uniref:Pol-like protein n=1 Tax=Plakobranchus ocellatus TaxID=259542 RepID=A0AAV4CNY0_9GAST|nr:Pol-like protein [Plakobranchus ocellatus]
MEGLLIRARARWIGEGEKPSKYFCNLENRHHISKKISSLIKEDGTEASSNDEIVKEVRAFYAKLFKSREDHIENVDLETKLNIDSPKLTAEEAILIEGKITYEEASTVLKNMKNNKSPGSDGFTIEFFKFFWRDIGYFLIKSISHSFDSGHLSITQREGLITCIPKPGKSKKQLKNWRPITLLNISYKIVSGCIAQRIKSLLNKITSTDQTGFLPGNFIGDNIRLLYDVLPEANEIKKKEIMILIDFEKAFDSIAWSFITKSLKIFNFKDDIVRWVRLFDNQVKSRCIVNNTVSDWFILERGCRQGDPISPYLFLIASEILASMTARTVISKAIK